MLELGAIVAGKYRIDRILGQGGMGVVAVATHVQLDQEVALKAMHDELAEDPANAERFMREARASARLKSEHVCHVSDVDQLPSGAPFLVMELLDGTDLANVIKHALVAPDIAAGYVLQACVGIAEAHALGLVHRDLKPANLFLTKRLDGTPLVKVLDFGIAKVTAEAELKITRTAAIIGSPGYMSPEQLRSARDVDPRSDLWSLGVILYELVSGRLPFTGDTITELAVKITIEPPDALPPTLEPRFAAIVARCLEKDLALRYATVGELAHDLAELAGPSAPPLVAAIQRVSRATTVPRPLATPLQIAMQATQVTSVPAPTAASTPAPLAPTRRTPARWLLVLGALALVGGAVAASYWLATRHDDAAEFERRQLSGYQADEKWLAIIDLGKSAAADDTELHAAIAEAKVQFAKREMRIVLALTRIGACPEAASSATMAGRYVDASTLAAFAADCKPAAGFGSGSNQMRNRAVYLALGDDARASLDARDFVAAFGDGQALLSERPNDPIALTLAARAACGLHDASAVRHFVTRLGVRRTLEVAAIHQACDESGIPFR